VPLFYHPVVIPQSSYEDTRKENGKMRRKNEIDADVQIYFQFMKE
jgi:hypothetical protein